MWLVEAWVSRFPLSAETATSSTSGAAPQVKRDVILGTFEQIDALDARFLSTGEG
jgi:hypothetical protein